MGLMANPGPKPGERRAAITISLPVDMLVRVNQSMQEMDVSRTRWFELLTKDFLDTLDESKPRSEQSLERHGSRAVERQGRDMVAWG